MGKEDLTREEQEKLDYIAWWWEQKLEKEKKKRERKTKRKLCLSGASYHANRVLAELRQYFRLLLNRK